MSSATGPRVVTAAILIPIVVVGVWWGPNWLIAGLAAVVAILALIEFFSLSARAGFHAYRYWTCFVAAGVMAEQWYASHEAGNAGLADIIYQVRSPKPSLELVLFIFAIGVAIITLASRRPLGEALSSVSVSAAGLVFIVLPFSAVVRIDGVDFMGPRLLLFVLALVWAGDICAFLIGRTIGRKKMAPHLSPNKTWEGAVGNLLGALLLSALFGYWMKVPPLHMFAMGVVGNVAGQIGDLFESAWKRSAGVKDSGTILPGHGGMLDRIDALILAAPAVWYYFQWVVIKKY